MASFRPPAPPPAQLVFQRPQQGLNPMQVAEFGLRLQALQRKREKQNVVDEFEQTKRALELRKLRSEVGDLDRAALARRAQSSVLLAPDQASKTERMDLLAAIDPDAALDFRGAMRAADREAVETMELLRKQQLGQMLQVSKVFRLYRQASGDKQDPELWRRVRAHVVRGGVPENALPEQPPKPEQVDKALEGIHVAMESLYQAGDFDAAIKEGREAEQADGLIPGTPEYQIRVAELLERRRALEEEKASRPLVQIQEGIPLGRGGQTTAEKDIMSADAMLANALRVEDLLFKDRPNGPLAEHMLGLTGTLNTGIATLGANLDLPVVSDLMEKAMPGDEYIVDAGSVAMQMQLLVNAYRRLVTGQAAAEQELKRYDRMLTTRMGRKIFMARFREFKFNILKQRHMRHKALAEGLFANELAMEAAIDNIEQGEIGPTEQRYIQRMNQLSRELGSGITDRQALVKDRKRFLQRQTVSQFEDQGRERPDLWAEMAAWTQLKQEGYINDREYRQGLEEGLRPKIIEAFPEEVPPGLRSFLGPTSATEAPQDEPQELAPPAEPAPAEPEPQQQTVPSTAAPAPALQSLPPEPEPEPDTGVDAEAEAIKNHIDKLRDKVRPRRRRRRRR